MKRTFLAQFGVLSLVVMLAIIPTFAAAHTLEWGVEVGDDFTYALQRKTLDGTYASLIPYWMNFVIALDEGQKFIATITELDEIPSEDPSSGSLPLAHATLTYENDSSNLLADTTAFAIMVNDWDFQADMLNISESPVTLVDTDTEWGLTESSSFTAGSAYYDYIFEWRYDKTTGTLMYSRFKLTTLGTTLIDIVMSQWEVGDPTILPPDLEMGTILIVAISGVVFVIIAFLAYRWVKKPKGIAAELGR